MSEFMTASGKTVLLPSPDSVERIREVLADKEDEPQRVTDLINASPLKHWTIITEVCIPLFMPF
jgi:hypothetical protein